MKITIDITPHKDDNGETFTVAFNAPGLELDLGSFGSAVAALRFVLNGSLVSWNLADLVGPLHDEADRKGFLSTV